MSSSYAEIPTSAQIAQDAEILIQTYLPPPLNPTSSKQEFILPLAVPQISFNDHQEASFARGHSPALGELGLTQQVMLSIVDGLNLAMAASPPTRIVGASGPVVGYLPWNWAKLSRASMHVDPRTGNRSIARSLTDHYLRAANISVFKPRGLSARICTTSAMLILTAKPEKTDDAMKKVGRGALVVARHLPITGLIVRQVSKSKANRDENKKTEDIYQPIAQRRLGLIDGRALPLSTGGSPPLATQIVMQTMSKYGVHLGGAREGKKEMERQRAMEAFDEAGVADGYGYHIDYSIGKGARAIERAERRRRQIGGQGRQLLLDLPKGPEGDLLRSWAADRLLWFVIMPAEKDMDIEDISFAESPANEENVTQKVWMGEMIFESEEMLDGK
ncbi:hypothetical protein EV361DRAFT_380923 [Lentinula raphanica]|uniref:Uncharacterized protein n=1 Tax=Lentinula raphanica TaxID=153919 RepID=A0AA38PKN6_9AGAR|nr:hypothetical protein C8R42DRAFT_617512 [Lentinula raphanica]KAJ3751696.1 hypothetical protein EV360DRAFT_56510 [Lentinula raphanica]KAJ3765535.1 hypothetical protein FB446DRAFT_457126 [Lentinula raphanica]KAJ3826391.1 hypothetical protein F5880DRAFT_1476369 [Lentinula raphanica]KAJ3844390.1 hypothetical protein F5878DRAFT_678980 [Lentinula raphanica]